MEELIAYNILGIIAVFIPLYLLLTVGPELTQRRGYYGILGFLTAAMIGGILFLLSVDTRVNWISPFYGRLARDVTAAIVEEIIRFPAILFAQYFVSKLNLQESEELLLSSSQYVEGEFTSILDPHGMGMYFGTGYGLGETLAFYVIPTILEFTRNQLSFDLGDELTSIFFRITAVMAHIGLTYLALAITSQRGFWRLTLTLHLISNVSNRVFDELAANDTATVVFVTFTRFAIILIVYFILRPKVRYLSPAVLVFLIVTLFLLVVLISTFIALLAQLLATNIF